MSLWPYASAAEFHRQLVALFEREALEINSLLFLAEKAQGNAYDCSETEVVAWYRNAMLIYDFLEHREQKPFISRIYMRLNIVRSFGWLDERSRPYLQDIIDWLILDLPTDLRQVEVESRDWMQLPVDRLRMLRILKMKLNVAEQLHQQGVALPEAIRTLLPFRPALP